MADRQIGNHFGVAAAGGTGVTAGSQGTNGGTAPGAGLKNVNILTIDDARARLQAIAPATYTNAELNKMTFNDMIFAIRSADHPSSIKQ